MNLSKQCTLEDLNLDVDECYYLPLNGCSDLLFGPAVACLMGEQNIEASPRPTSLGTVSSRVSYLCYRRVSAMCHVACKQSYSNEAVVLQYHIAIQATRVFPHLNRTGSLHHVCHVVRTPCPIRSICRCTISKNRRPRHPIKYDRHSKHGYPMSQQCHADRRSDECLIFSDKICCWKGWFWCLIMP